jgi:hypothetical protein
MLTIKQANIDNGTDVLYNDISYDGIGGLRL